MGRVLGNRVYRHLFAAQVVALVGTGLLTVALGLLAYDLAPGSAGAVVGTALTIKIVAYAGLAPVISALVERIPRRALLVGSDVVRATVAALLPFVDAVWQIYVLIFALQAASAAFTPAFQAVIPSVLPDERDYTRALSLSRLAYDLEALLSPALAAVLLGLISHQGLFVGTLLGFAGSAALVMTVRLDDTPPTTTPRSSFWHRMTVGTRTFLAVRQLRALLALDMAVATATALVLVNTVVIVQELLELGPSSVAVALAFYGTGSMIVALALPPVLERAGDRRVMRPAGLLVTTGVACSAVLFAVGDRTSTTFAMLLAVWLLLGAANSLVLTPASRLLRRHSTEHNRPAVFAAQFSLSHACFLVTYPIAGWVGAYANLTAASLALAGIAGAAAIVAVHTWRPDPAAEPVAPGVHSRAQ